MSIKSVPKMKVGDMVEVDGDYGWASNAPWCNFIHSFDAQMTVFNEGDRGKEYLVSYFIKPEGYLESYEHVKMKGVTVHKFKY